MSTRKGAALGEFHQSVYHATSTTKFTEKFQNSCQNGDRREMIKSLVDLDKVKNLKMDESYNEKNPIDALNYYEKSRRITDETSKSVVLKKINYLNKALFAADSKSSILPEILLSRARCWYTIGHYVRCVKDCDYLTTIKTQISESSIDENSKIRDLQTDCTTLRTKSDEMLRTKNKNYQKKLTKNFSTSLPKVSGKINVKLRSCSDGIAMFHDDQRGRHLLATRNIRTGSVLIVDKPFSFSTDGHALTTNCLHCHRSLLNDDEIVVPCENCQTVAYCSLICREKSWNQYHKYECTIFDYFYETNLRDVDQAQQHRSHLLLAWRTTVAIAIDKSTNTLNQEFLRYQQSPNDEKSYFSLDYYDCTDYRTVYNLKTHCADAPVNVNLSRSLKSIFFAKCLNFVIGKYCGTKFFDTTDEDLIGVAVAMLRHVQAVDCNAYEIVENFRDDGTKIWTPRNVGGAIYTTVSLVNHGCYPNVVRHSYPDGKVVVRALRFIPKGSEILDCYGPHFVNDSTFSRRRYLSEKYNFSCTCEACTNDWQLPDDETVTYRCSSCGTSAIEYHSRCSKCNKSMETKKLQLQLAKSTKKRVAAIGKMLNGNYVDALSNLLEHADVVDKIVASPSLEAIKTQQSIVQCYNSLGSTCLSNDNSNSIGD